MSWTNTSLLRNRGRLGRGGVSDICEDPRQRVRRQWEVLPTLPFIYISFRCVRGNGGTSIRTARFYRMKGRGLVELGRGRWISISRRKEGMCL